MVVLLQELVLALGRLVGDELGVLSRLQPLLLLGEIAETLQLGLLPDELLLFLLVALEALQLAHLPGLVLHLIVLVICVDLLHVEALVFGSPVSHGALSYFVLNHSEKKNTILF